MGKSSPYSDAVYDESVVTKPTGCRLDDEFRTPSREFLSLPTLLDDRGVTGWIRGIDAGYSEFLYTPHTNCGITVMFAFPLGDSFLRLPTGKHN